MGESIAGNIFSYGDITPGNHTVQFRGAISDDYGANWYFSNIASDSYTVGSNIVHNFKILVSINQLNGTEAQYASWLAADGVWAFVTNSTAPGLFSANPLIERAQMPSVLTALNAHAWTVSEDLYPDWGQTDETQGYLTHNVNAQMVYQESGTWDPPQVLPNDTTLLPEQINNAAAARGNTIVVHSRSYLQFGEHVRNALDNPNCSGVAFEANPHDLGGWDGKLNEGIIYCLSQGKKCYLLWPPRGGSTDYRADLRAAINFVSQSGQFGNPNLHVVLAAYVRADTGVSFINFSNLDDPNTVLSAMNWLKTYRGH